MSTTQGSDDDDILLNRCLETRYWFYFLASSLIVFFAGVIVILTWRIVQHFAGCGGWTAAVNGRSSRAADDESPIAKVVARVRCKCEKLVSGQTLTGRVVVSSHRCYTCSFVAQLCWATLSRDKIASVRWRVVLRNALTVAQLLFTRSIMANRKSTMRFASSHR